MLEDKLQEDRKLLTDLQSELKNILFLIEELEKVEADIKNNNVPTSSDPATL